MKRKVRILENIISLTQHAWTSATPFQLLPNPFLCRVGIVLSLLWGSNSSQLNPPRSFTSTYGLGWIPISIHRSPYQPPCEYLATRLRSYDFMLLDNLKLPAITSTAIPILLLLWRFSVIVCVGKSQTQMSVSRNRQQQREWFLCIFI